MINRIIEFAEKNNMFDGCTEIIIGLSGGADSVCLFRVLCELREKYGYKLLAVHVHHGIRGEEADRDMLFCIELCDKYKVSYKIVKYDVLGYAKEKGLSVEEAGRLLRYEAFEECCDPNSRIAVAHHMNDRAETVLFNICRGTGLKGLGGIKPVRDKVIRPLLCCQRWEIEKYLSENGQEYCTDSTNGTDDYSRNLLRNKVFPLLIDNVNSGTVENITSLATKAVEAEEYLEKITIRKYQDKVAYLRNTILLRRLQDEDEFMIRRLILNAIREMKCSLKDVSSVHIENVMKLLYLQVGGRCDICGGLLAENTREGLLFYHKDSEEVREPVNIDIPAEKDVDNLTSGEVISWEVVPWENSGKFIFRLYKWDINKKISNEVYTKCFDYDKIKFGLQLRSRMPGDVIAIDTNNHHKKIKKYFVDKGMSRIDKQAAVLLADGNHIMWIVGDRIGADYKISDSTKTVLEVEYGGQRFCYGKN